VLGDLAPLLRRHLPDGDPLLAFAATLEVLGEPWTLLIIRDVFNRRRRFDDLNEQFFTRGLRLVRARGAGGGPADSQGRAFLAVLGDTPRFEIETRTGRLRLMAGDGVLVFDTP